MSTTHDTNTSSTGSRRRGSLPATAPLRGWRTVDLLTVTFLGLAFGIIFFGWTFAWNASAVGVQAAFPPLYGVMGAPWLMAGIVGGLVVRRPGAAFLCEMVAAMVELLLVSSWGVTGLVSGAVQGIGAELIFLVFGYRAFGLVVASLAGALAGLLESFWEIVAYYPAWEIGPQVLLVVMFVIGGALVAGPLSWVLTRALAKAGALNAFPPGQELRESRAV